MRPIADEGYFPEGRSILRRVHAERAVGLFYGQRALMIGALKPLNFVGTIEHTRARTAPFARLAHTGKAFEAVFFGTRREADEVLARVHRMHRRVVGVLPADAGPTSAGTPYSAFDPELMLWTVAVIADSAMRFYDLLVTPLIDPEREALWREYVRFGELFGMPAGVAPATHRGFRDYWERALAGDDIHLTPAAREVGHGTALAVLLPGLIAGPAVLAFGLYQERALPGWRAVLIPLGLAGVFAGLPIVMVAGRRRRAAGRRLRQLGDITARQCIDPRDRPEGSSRARARGGRDPCRGALAPLMARPGDTLTTPVTGERTMARGDFSAADDG